MKTVLFFLPCLLLYACNKTEQSTIEQYTIDQFYKNLQIDGGNFNSK